MTHLAHSSARPLSRPRLLLACGVMAGPMYVTVALAQAFTREGFDLARHPWSFLANGDLGWIQTLNFVLTALAVIAAAAGLRHALARGRGGRWAPILVGTFGASMIGAALFPADPAMGFPAGTPEGPGAITLSGMLHLAVGGVGFLCASAACYVIASRYARDGRKGWAWYSRATGTLFLGSFVGIASGGGVAWANLAFIAGILALWTWMSLMSLNLSRSA
ncbi:DUF998 domain-containing protein [Nonomuraea gerenzanensis]|uniref:DUF998 domain-containing protein n=1 Tax=Nonomuraea gerenzanensis TaxID=93944 RepID=A0A1M4E523_9ACTN|nr:DUF998 domain-containing protein [Nonomuraea gerenzanensis]UBU16071.1 DUF998 domain-containing protein [Nonomuraea gerenzanensis]SBO93874.1 hypothetical protein BN4615_P3390 [Nonomuraea gerenzanensis]